MSIQMIEKEVNKENRIVKQQQQTKQEVKRLGKKKRD
jgi:hypothetical protein